MKDTQVKFGRLEFISYLRVFGMVCILLCHYVQEIPNGLVQSTAQVFNIGVFLFFIISGFCFGIQGEIKSAGKWYLKRLKRIYIPYEIFLLMYFALFLILGKRIFWRDWGMYALGMQGDYFRIPGIEQTWFITPLIVCYLLTPLISLSVPKLKTASKSVKLIIAAAFAAAYIAVCFVPNNNFYVITSPIVFYIAAYLWGRNYKKIRPEKKTAIISFFVVFAAFAVRFAASFLLSDTLLYRRLISGASYYIAAFGIFIIFEYLFFNAGKNKFISAVESISFEVYLTHYLFLRGACLFTYLTPYWAVNLLLAAAAAFISAIAVHLISIFIQKKIIK